MTDANSTEEVVNDPKVTKEEEELTDKTTVTEENIEDPEEEEVVKEDDDKSVSDDPKVESRANAEIRDLRGKVKLYQDMAERNFAQTPRVVPVEEKLPDLDEEIEPGVNARIEKRAEQTEHMQGQLIDKLDELNAHVKIPNFATVQKEVEAHRLQKAQQGQYISRMDSYELLLAKGLVMNPSPPKKTLSIKKSPVKVVTDKTKVIHRGKGAEKDFKDLSVSEQESSLEGKLF